jgi:thiol-disulfide isomerase/thioredoxin
MDVFFKEKINIDSNNMAIKIIKAYYLPSNPDWEKPDHFRDSIIASHFFDYFDPSDKFYINSNIFPEKIDIYLKLKSNKKDAWGQPIRDEIIIAKAAEEFIEKTKTHIINYEFCLNYILKKFEKENMTQAFIYIYDKYLKQDLENCEPSNNSLNWARKKASIIQGVDVGNKAPDFNIENNLLKLYDIKSNYTIIIFWASWCAHCSKEMPIIKTTVEQLNLTLTSKGEIIQTIAISLDKDETKWQNYVKENELFSFLNYSELKGWGGEITKKYNVTSIPSIFVLDNSKKIIAKPKNSMELKKFFDSIIE